MLNRRHVLLTAGATLALAGSAAKAATSGAETQLNKLLDEFFTIELDESPELSTSLGLDVGARKADKSKLSHSSIASQQHDVRLNTEQLAKLKTVDRKALTGMAAVNYGPGDPNLAHCSDERVAVSAITDAADMLRRYLSG